jgi:bifunctional DNase/RNase
MIEVVIDSIRVSLMSQHRLVILKDINKDRYIPIWIGPFEAEAITIELQDVPPPRPLTHDLIKSIIHELGGRVVHVLVNDLRNDVFYARIVVEIDGRQVEIDSRSSDAIAVAVRVKVPIFVADTVMEKAAIEPDEDVEHELVIGSDKPDESGPREAVDEEKLSAFADFVNSLDLDIEDDDDDN